MTLDILKVVMHGKNLQVMRLLEVHNHPAMRLNTTQLRLKAGLSRKQIYTSLWELKDAGIVIREAKTYRLSHMAQDLLKYLDKIEELENRKTQYKIKEIITRDNTLEPQEKATVIQELHL